MHREAKAQHQRAIDRVTAKFAAEPTVLAVIICGSVARGVAKDDSDVDVMLVVTAAEYERRESAGDLCFIDFELCDYPGGYVDGKIIDIAFMRDAAAFGSEPCRHAFIGAFTAFSHDSEVDQLVGAIPVYPEDQRQHRIQSYMSQIAVDRGFFFGEAQKRNDPYLLHRTSANIVLFAGRLILAHNRILFPCHKRLLEYVEAAPEKPEGFCDIARQFLRDPTRDSLERLWNLVDGWQDWGVTCDAVTRYIADTETTWRTRTTAVTDW